MEQKEMIGLADEIRKRGGGERNGDVFLCLLYVAVTYGKELSVREKIPSLIKQSTFDDKSLLFSISFLRDHLGEKASAELMLSFSQKLSLISSEEVFDLVQYCDGLNMDCVSTPIQVTELACRLLRIAPEDTVLDIGSGKGTFLGHAAYTCWKQYGSCPHAIGQEINPEFIALSEIRLKLMKVPFEIFKTDVIHNSEVPGFTKAFVFPVLGYRYGDDAFPSFNKKGQTLFSSRSSSEWMFVFRAIENLKEANRVVALLPAGVLFRESGSAIRKYLVQNHLLEGIIELPSGVLGYSGVQMELLVFQKGSDGVKVFDTKTLMGDKPARFNDIVIPVDEVFRGYSSDECPKRSEKEIESSGYILTVDRLVNGDPQEKIENPAILGEKAEIIRGCQYTLHNFESQIVAEKTGYSILTSSDIEDGIIDYSGLKNIVPDSKYDKFALRNGDLVLTSKSSKVKTAIAEVTNNAKIIVTGGMLIIRPNSSELDAAYLKMFLDSKLGRAILKTIQKGAFIVTITGSDLSKITIDCPKIEIQKQMSKRYASLLSTYDGIKKEMHSIEEQLANFYEEAGKED